MRMRRILLASDFSKASRRAFVTAVQTAKRDRATLTILHVLAPIVPVSADQYTAFAQWDEIEEQSRAWAQRQLGKLTAAAKKAGVRAVGILVDGSPAREIVRTARRRHADLLVIGTHGRTGLAKLFLGSVAAGVVATSPCPVMTVRGG
jgi:nucleotide-binding universal stress UspA family protein